MDSVTGVSEIAPMEIMMISGSRFHDVNVPNLWNPVGNPWKRDDSIFVHCYDVNSSTSSLLPLIIMSF